jgi:hypothetical protein
MGWQTLLGQRELVAPMYVAYKRLSAGSTLPATIQRTAKKQKPML